jgi:hypothetical protein
VNQLVDYRWRSRNERDANASNLASPHELLGELRVQNQRLLSRRFADEDVNVLAVGRHRDKNLAAHTERGVLVVRLFSDFGESERKAANICELHARRLS